MTNCRLIRNLGQSGTGFSMLIGIQPSVRDRTESAGQNRRMNGTRKQPISTPDAPAAIGPYSQAVVTGDLVYTSGQVGFDPSNGQLVEGGVAREAEQVLRNLEAVLLGAGSSLAQVVKTTVFLKDMNDFAAMNEVYARFLASEGVVPPARSTVEVARLPRDARVEIEVIARLETPVS